MIGQTILPGTKWWTGSRGFASLQFYYNAATHISGPCNDAELIRSHLTPGGGYKVTIYTGQRFGCFVPWSSRIIARRFTNSESNIELFSDGQLGILTGTEVGMMRGTKPGSVLFATAEGTMNVVASNGDKAPLPAGYMADVSPRGIVRTLIPEPSYTIKWVGDYAVFDAPEGVFLFVNGQYIAKGAKVYLPQSVTAQNLVGVSRVWPLTPDWWTPRNQRVGNQ